MATWEGDRLYQQPQLVRLPDGETGAAVLIEVLTFPDGRFFWSGGSVVPLEVRPLYSIAGQTFIGEPAVYARGPKSLLRFEDFQGVKLCAKNDRLEVRVEVVPAGAALTIDGEGFTIEGVPLIV
ncbi:MAG: hypothetical protein AB8B99_03010 [Phormidesmis sp.]